MKFLFVLQYPGYLRYFDTVIKRLAERGHTVVVGYNSVTKQAEGGEALDGLPVEVFGVVPKRSSLWGPVAKSVRGTIDYTRFLDPYFADTPYLRDRMRKVLPPITGFLGRFDTLGPTTTKLLLDIGHACERAIPSSYTLNRFLRQVQPDAVIVSPLVMDMSPQVDIVKSARALKIPCGLCVASWDHLTTKGLMRIKPDIVAVWNEHQRDEAVRFHRISADSIVVTGAQPFDRWFDRQPRRSRGEFCRMVGLPVDQPIVLFVGSTASISHPDAETMFVREWASRLRAELSKRHLEASILIRPHPYNSEHWANADVSDIENVAVFPRYAANPVNEDDRADYFDTLYHSAAVVGINTSAMIEAAIVGRTVHTILDPAFATTQEGTIHFRYLLPTNGGFLRVAGSLDEHVTQVADTLRDPDANKPALEAFVRSFVRPRGLTTAATPVVTDALEGLARRDRKRAVHVPVHLYPVTAVLWLLGFVVVYRDLDRLRRRFPLWINRWRKEWKKLLRKRQRSTKLEAKRHR
jgi:hypothetical protein